jgi:hypothetical protein
MCCTVSASFLQHLQVGPPSNSPMVRRCFLTATCPVRIATTILSWRLLNLSRLSARFLHDPLIKSLPSLWPVRSLQVRRCCFIVQALMISLTEHLGIPRAGSGPLSTLSSRTTLCPRQSVTSILPGETFGMEKVFYPFLWQSRGNTLAQFWLITSCLFTKTCLTFLMHFVKIC